MSFHLAFDGGFFLEGGADRGKYKSISYCEYCDCEYCVVGLVTNGYFLGNRYTIVYRVQLKNYCPFERPMAETKTRTESSGIGKIDRSGRVRGCCGYGVFQPLYCERVYWVLVWYIVIVIVVQ